MNLLIHHTYLIKAQFLSMVCFLMLITMPNYSFAAKVTLLRDSIESEILQSILAKELCSCVYIVKPGTLSTQEQANEVNGQQTELNRLDLCLENSGLPISRQWLERIINIQIDTKHDKFIISPEVLPKILTLFQGETAIARFFPEEHSCKLVFK